MGSRMPKAKSGSSSGVRPERLRIPFTPPPPTLGSWLCRITPAPTVAPGRGPGAGSRRLRLGSRRGPIAEGHY